MSNESSLVDNLRYLCIASMSESEKTAFLMALKLRATSLFTPEEFKLFEHIGSDVLALSSGDKKWSQPLSIKNLGGLLIGYSALNYHDDWPANFGEWVNQMRVWNVSFKTKALRINNLQLLLTREGLRNFNEVFPELVYLEFVNHDNAPIAVAEVREMLSARITINPINPVDT